MASRAAAEENQQPQSRLWSRLTEARHRQFVGRAPERTLFNSALSAAGLPFFVLYIFGPGGVGKTTLLHELAYICRQAGTQALYLDGRDLQPSAAGVRAEGVSAEGFLEALRLTLQLPPAPAPLQALLDHPGRRVILIDTYETLAPLDNWLVQRFLPDLPENILLVLAGRQAPSPAWQADPGLRALTRVLPLRNFSSAESELFLARRELPAGHYQAILNFTHGHPLALSLVADKFAQSGAVLSQTESEAGPDLITTLLQRLIQEAPTPAHRAALELCSLVRVTTEPLLAALLEIPDAYDLFEWLRSLSFIQFGPRGLFPHDLTQNVLDADLRWRNPDRYLEWVERARHYYIARILSLSKGPQVSSHEQQALVIDYIFLYRHSPVIQPFVKVSPTVAELPDLARPADWPLLRQMVARHEGEASARLAEFWFSRQPQGVVVWREANLSGPPGAAPAPPLGFMLTLALHAATPDDLAQDPAAAAAWAYLQRHAPLRPGEKATLFRFWLGDEGYQQISPVQGLIGVAMVWHYLTAPGLAFSFFPCADPAFWAPLCAHARLDRLPEADYEVGGRHYGVYGHDWRVMPPLAWLALMAGQEFGLATPAPPAQPLAVLSYPDFTAAVREALRSLADPQQLQANPLLRSRLVVESNQPGSPAGRLRALLLQAIESLQATPRQARRYRALYHTYLHPAPSQEQAAERLDLPYSTFRRHLKAGLAEVTRLLWEQEIGS